MMDEYDHAQRSNWFPGEYDPQWSFDILEVTMHRMSLRTDCAVVLRVLLDKYGWATVGDALEDAATDNTSGAAVTEVERQMRPILGGSREGVTSE